MKRLFFTLDKDSRKVDSERFFCPLHVHDVMIT